MLILVASVTLAAPVAANPPAFSTGNDLLNTCAPADDDDRMVMECFTYLQGFVDAVAVTTFEAHGHLPFCVPAGATIGQTRDIMIQRLRGNPEIRHLPASVLIMVALQRAYPCPPATAAPPQR